MPVLMENGTIVQLQFHNKIANMLHLETLNKLRNQIVNDGSINEADWHLFQKAMFENGIGMEETLKFLYQERPKMQQFHQWLSSTKTYQNYTPPNVELDDVLSTDDLSFWHEHGYIVLKNAISATDASDTRNAILAFLNTSINEPSTWYQNHEAKEGLMVLFTQHPALEKNRTSPIIRKAYEQLYGSKEIFSVIDKVSFNPPETHHYQFKGSPLHWDVSLQTPIPYKLQGLLYLTDVYEDSGAFHCVPGFHRTIEKWLSEIPDSNINPRDYAIETLKPIPITGKAGDLIIWHQALPHCATPNKSNLPRIVQYLTYFPTQLEEQRIWK